MLAAGPLPRHSFQYRNPRNDGLWIRESARHVRAKVAAVEILVGITIFAVVTGLVFARFSRPSASVIFSRNAVIDSFNGQPTLMLRAGNQRQNQILEASEAGRSIRYLFSL
jgi:hypothetical protein